MMNPHELDVYGKRGITLVRGRGTRLWDDHGNEYLDCMSSHGAAIFGHAHPAIVDALTCQASELASVPGSFYHPQKLRLMERLVGLAPAGLARVFLCNSGTESIEAALKLARASTGRSRIIAAKRGFHGRSFGAMSATFDPKQHALYAPVVPDVGFIAYNKTEGLEDALDDRVAALVLELVQGEGGVYPAEKEFIARASELCRRQGILLVIDEVQTGFGRTGRLFACEHYELTPDILCVAKGIAAGFPMGAIIVRQELEFPPGSHGSTFGGNALACAVANTVLDLVTADGFLKDVEAKGEYFRGGLKGHHVRGIGLMTGIDLREPARPYLERFADAGILALTAGKKVLRFLPPLIISREELDEVTQAVHEILETGAVARSLPAS
jgi:acetylornithine/LysW-gamma-L-lysine aminotransferase